MGSDRPDTDTEMKPLEKMALTLSLALILGVAAFQTLARAHAFPVRSDRELAGRCRFAAKGDDLVWTESWSRPSAASWSTIR